jgi:hypothetical protein
MNQAIKITPFYSLSSLPCLSLHSIRRQQETKGGGLHGSHVRGLYGAYREVEDEENERSSFIGKTRNSAASPVFAVSIEMKSRSM